MAIHMRRMAVDGKKIGLYVLLFVMLIVISAIGYYLVSEAVKGYHVSEAERKAADEADLKRQALNEAAVPTWMN